MKQAIKAINQNKGIIPPIVIAFLYGLGISAQYSTSDIKVTDGITALTSLGVFVIAFYSFGQWRAQHNAQVFEKTKERLREEIYNARNLDDKKLQTQKEINKLEAFSKLFLEEGRQLIKNGEKYREEVQNLLDEGKISVDNASRKYTEYEKEIQNLLNRSDDYRKSSEDNEKQLIKTRIDLERSTHKVASICNELIHLKSDLEGQIDEIINIRENISKSDYTGFSELQIDQHAEIDHFMRMIK